MVFRRQFFVVDEGSEPVAFWRRYALLALAMGLPVLEAAAGLIWHVDGTAALAPQTSAPAPFGVFHDLRWLLVYNRSWAMFAVGVVALVVERSLLTALFVRAAWPGGAHSPERPEFREALRWSVPFTVIALLVLAPWALLLFGMAVVSLSWLFFTAVPPALAVAVLLHHGAAGDRWWRSAPPLRSVGVMLLTIAALTVGAGVMDAVPAAAKIPVAAATGLFNAWAWCAVVRRVVTRPAPRPLRPVAPVGIAVVLVVVLGGAALGFSAVTSRHKTPSSGRSVPGARPVLVVTGFESQWDGTPGSDLGGGFDEERFSYRGLDAGGRPLPYDGHDTEQSLPHLEMLMATQVAALHQQSGRPVALVAESEGSFVAKAYLVDHPAAPVDLLVMLSPLAHTGSAVYPPQGADGWGLASSWALNGITALMGAVSPFSLSPHTPLLQSFADRGHELSELMGCGLPGVRQVAIAPVADAVTGPEIPSGAVAVRVVPAFHGGLLGDPAVRAKVRTVLHGGDAPAASGWAGAARVFSAATAAWRVPALAGGLRRDGGGVGQACGTPATATSAVAG
jgi:hypothetical protein